LSKDIEVITGCMFAGKTTELLKRLKKTNKKYLLIKPKTDTRNAGDRLISHDGIEAQALTVHKLSDIFDKLDNIQLVAIDEAQFFDHTIIQAINYLVAQKIKIMIAGLEKDYLNQPFGAMDKIIKMSTSITRLHARCNQCGEDAYYSNRTTKKTKTQVLVGDSNNYEALCEICFSKRVIL